jgi:uncharacterized protein
MELSFETIKFFPEEEGVRADFLRQFSFHIKHSELKSIGNYKVENGNIIFPEANEKRVSHKFNKVLNKGFHHLTCRLTGKPSFYVHRGSGIPLLGNGAFGLVDRNTNHIEVKPITGCNVACVFCSVTDEKRVAEIVVEMEYLVEETEKLCNQKDCDDIEIFLNAHGEPTLYADLEPLIKNLSKIPQIKRISMITNGTLLTPQKLDALKAAGLTQLNLSLNSLKKDKSKEIMGKTYTLTTVLRLMDHAVNTIPLVISPVWVPKLNDDDMEDMCKWVADHRDHPFPPKIVIQNFLEYKYGSNPGKQRSWDDFYAELERLEKTYNIPLRPKNEDFKFSKTKSIPKPFKKGDIISVELKCPGRLPREVIGAAGNRSISVFNCTQTHGFVKVKLVRDKHNIFSGVLV